MMNDQERRWWCFFLVGIVTILVVPATAQDHWPQFRGVGAIGTSDNTDLPDQWSASRSVAWKKDLPGKGWSSPVVWGGRVFLSTVVSQQSAEEAKKGLYFGGDRSKVSTAVHQWKVICLQLKTGEVLWEQVPHKAVPSWPLHIKNSYASETPVTDGEHVYVYFGNVGVFCYDLEGQPVWSLPVQPHKVRNNWGTAASPVLHGEKLLIVNDNDERSYLHALDKRTGKELWRVERSEGSNWATPYVWTNSLRTEIITPGTGKTRSYDLDGKLLYEFGGGSSITIAAPYSQFGLLFVSSGYVLDQKKPLFAIRPGASGDISLEDEQTSNDYIAWCQPQAAPYNPATVIWGDLLYVLLDRGYVSCYEAKTGRLVYDKRRLPRGRAFTSSPWAYNGKIFCLNEYGTTYVVRAGRKFEILHQNSLAEDDMCMATPALVGDRLLIRTSERIYCIRRL